MRPRARLEEAMRASERPSDRGDGGHGVATRPATRTTTAGGHQQPPCPAHPIERPVELYVPNTREQ